MLCRLPAALATGPFSFGRQLPLSPLVRIPPCARDCRGRLLIGGVPIVGAVLLLYIVFDMYNL